MRADGRRRNQTDLVQRGINQSPRGEILLFPRPEENRSAGLVAQIRKHDMPHRSDRKIKIHPLSILSQERQRSRPEIGRAASVDRLSVDPDPLSEFVHHADSMIGQIPVGIRTEINQKISTF